MSSFNAQRRAMSKAVDKIFEKYTIIPSSETEDEGVQASSDLLNSELNPELENRPSGTSSSSIRSNANEHIEAISTIEPHKTQLPLISNTNVAYARKTIPSALAIPVRPPSEDSDEISETENAAPAVLNIPSCDACYEYGITCKKKARGHACVACTTKRKKCSLVPELSPKPGARGTSTDEGSNNVKHSSIFSFEDDTRDESFEMDSEKVTLQRILGHLLRLNRKQKERFEKLEDSLKELNNKIESVRVELGRLSTV